MARDAASPNDDEVAAARAEAEQRRAALAAGLSTLRVRVERAVEHWQDRASPEAVRRRTTAYVAHERDELARTLTRRARRHPFATALLGSGLALTTWGTVKKLPKGLLLAGAGLYLLSRDDTDKTDDARDIRPAGQVPAARLPARPADIQRPARPLAVKAADDRASCPRPQASEARHRTRKAADRLRHMATAEIAARSHRISPRHRAPQQTTPCPPPTAPQEHVPFQPFPNSSR